MLSQLLQVSQKSWKNGMCVQCINQQLCTGCAGGVLLLGCAFAAMTVCTMAVYFGFQ
jgi:hypothetical protein